MINPLISICIPTYNGGKYLQQALDSIKAQTYKNFEVVVSDDQSSDETLKICEEFQKTVDFPVFIHSHIPQGIGANWNNCIAKANGQYIKFLFQDDILEDNCLADMIVFLNDEKLDIVACKRAIIDENSQDVTDGPWFFNNDDLQKKLILQNNHKLNKSDFKSNPFGGSNFVGEPVATLFSKKLFLKIGDFNEVLKQDLDTEYWLRVLKHYEIGILNKKLIKFRLHQDQASSLNKTKGVKEKELILDYYYKNFFFAFSNGDRKAFFVRKFSLIKTIYQFWKS